jgi:uncharacterized protein with NRDE domain
MCLAVLALDAHPRYAVVLAANRDEYHARVAVPAAWWPGDHPILAGRDRVAGGTWLGVDRRGRYAFVTNVREPGRHQPAAPTRGMLVPRVLRAPTPIEDAVRDAVRDGAAMNGFNLLAGEGTRAAWGSNRAEATRPLARGVHGVSNALLDTPWPKVVRSKARLARWCAAASDDADELFDMLRDDAPAPDAELPHTGVAPEWERTLSAPFIRAPEYGTRCSTLLLIDRDRKVRLVERTFDRTGAMTSVVDQPFEREAIGATNG